MSHFTKIEQANIIDTEAFVSACKELGLVQVRRNVEITDFYDQKILVDVAITVGKYDIALKKNASGTYDMVADWWAIRRERDLSDKLKKCRTDEDLQNMLLKHTTKHTIVSRYRRQGYRATVREDEEENLHVELVRVR